MKTLTKTLSVGLLGLCLLASACGNDTPGPGQDPNTPPPNKCGSCASFETCNSATNTCSINPNSTWFLAVESAKIASTKTTGEAWDSLGGAPDPFVMLDLRKTTTKQDTFSPTWGEGASYTAAVAILKQLLKKVQPLCVWALLFLAQAHPRAPWLHPA